VSGTLPCRADTQCRPRFGDIWRCRRHVADMSPTCGAKVKGYVSYYGVAVVVYSQYHTRRILLYLYDPYHGCIEVECACGLFLMCQLRHSRDRGVLPSCNTYSPQDDKRYDDRLCRIGQSLSADSSSSLLSV